MTTAEPGYKPKDLKDVQGFLQDHTGIEGVLDLFEWTHSKNLVKARLKMYLADKDKFGKIAAAFKDMGGQWVSAKKESHFKVILSVEKAPVRRRALVDIAKDLRRILEELEAWSE